MRRIVRAGVMPASFACPDATEVRAAWERTYALYSRHEAAAADGGGTGGGEGEAIAGRHRAGAARAVLWDQPELVLGRDGPPLRAARQSVLAGPVQGWLYQSAALAGRGSGTPDVRVRGDEHGVAGHGGGGRVVQRGVARRGGGAGAEGPPVQAGVGRIRRDR